MDFATLLAASGSSSSGGGSGFFLLLLLVAVVVMFFFTSRNGRRQRARTLELQRNLVPGAEIMTGSGIYGTVVEALDDRVRIEVSPGVTIMVAKQAIVRTVEATAAEPAAPEVEAEEPTRAPVAE